MRLASSWTVIVSGSTISREILSFASCWPWPLRRWVRRRNAATERMRSSSPEVALATVRRPRLRCSPPRLGRGVGSMILAAGVRTPGRRTTTRRVSSSSAAGRAAGVTAATGAAAGAATPTLRGNAVAGVAAGSPPPRRRRASSSDWRLNAASWARRVSSSRRRASAASRSARSRVSRSRRISASPSWRRRSSSSRARASSSARARASTCSSVRVRRTTPVLGGATVAAVVGPRGATIGVAAAGAAVAATGLAAAGAACAGASPGPTTRRFTFSTTTALLRPWEKLWRTVPCSTGRFR